MTALFEQVQKAYADFYMQFEGHLTFTLNMQCENPSHEAMSSLISKLFYRLECNEFGYKKRENYKKKCRIERIVSIEEKTKVHAHIILKRFGSYSDEAIAAKLALAWNELNGTSSSFNSEYLIEKKNFAITSNSAISIYCTKDVAKQLQNSEDVLDLRSSFICKHSNKQ